MKAAILSYPRTLAIFWDIDGTLYNSYPILKQAYQEAFRNTEAHLGYTLLSREPTAEEILPHVGKSSNQIIDAIAPKLSQKEKILLSNAVLQALVVLVRQGKGVYYRGMKSTLAELHKRGYRFFNASNGRSPYVKAILEVARVLPYFEQGQVSTVDTIPSAIACKAELIRQTLVQKHIPKEAAVLIGDRYTDRDAAISNGIHFIAVSYGHGCPQEWQGASLRVDRLSELTKHL